MKARNSGPVIRIIKLLLDAVWVGLVAALVVLAVWLVMFGNVYRLPWYEADIRIKRAAVAYAVTLTETGVSLHDPQCWDAADEADLFDAAGHIAILPPDRLFAALYNLRILLGLGFALAVIHLLRRLFGDLKGNTPFTRANAARVRAVGLFIFLGHAAITALDFGLRHYLKALVTTRGLSLRTDFDPSFLVLFLGLVLIAIAELFRHGVELEEERALTI